MPPAQKSYALRATTVWWTVSAGAEVAGTALKAGAPEPSRVKSISAITSIAFFTAYTPQVLHYTINASNTHC